MSALARYFYAKGMNVGGYDRTESDITRNLQGEGMILHFDDNKDQIPALFNDAESTLIIYTPAVPEKHSELSYFRANGFTVLKRSQVLGFLSSGSNTIAVAGTHGKTTVSTMVSYFLRTGGIDCSAFLGGISRNFGTNMLIGTESDVIVAEADEFDRSFLQLEPWISVVTSIDEDHLDIYSGKTDLEDTFNAFLARTKRSGAIVYKRELSDQVRIPEKVKSYTYSIVSKDADFYADNIRIQNGTYCFDLVWKDKTTITGLELGLPSRFNVENAIAAGAVTLLCNAGAGLEKAIAGFKGIKRRFDKIFSDGGVVYIDDYAHHPEEIRACLTSVRELHSGKKITAVFQPHLYSRTRDFADAFASVLSLCDELILLDIYPAREEPIPGVTSEVIFNKINGCKKTMIDKSQLINMLEKSDVEVLVTMGAGDIDSFVEPINDMLHKRYR